MLSTGSGRAADRRPQIGRTSEAVQRQLGVDQPDFGAPFDAMLLRGDRVHATMRAPERSADLRQPIADEGLDAEVAQGAYAASERERCTRCSDAAA